MKTGEMETELHTFLTSAVRGDHIYAPATLSLGKELLVPTE